jgi:hypothetical protein
LPYFIRTREVFGLFGFLPFLNKTFNFGYKSGIFIAFAL